MLQTRHAPAASELVLAPDVMLARSRAHEVAGPARAVFALLAAARLSGPMLWVEVGRPAERLLGDGVCAFLDPGRLVMARATKPADGFWAAEEALRSGQTPLVVAELPAPPELTPVRRLHLAAEAGALVAGGEAPLALLLTPGPGGAPGIETRWLFAPAPGGTREATPRWRLTRARARMAPERTGRHGSRMATCVSGRTPRTRTGQHLLDDELRVQRAGRLDRLKDVDHIARGYAERIEAGHHLRQRHRVVDDREPVPRLLVDRGIGARDHHRLASRRRGWAAPRAAPPRPGVSGCPGSPRPG